MKQTRKAVSLSREDYDTAMALAAAHGTSAAQVVTRGLKALVNGEIAMGETRSAREIGDETKRVRGIEPLMARGRPNLTRAELDRRVAARDASRKADAILAGPKRVVVAPVASLIPYTPVRYAPGPDEIKPTCALCTKEIHGAPVDAPIGRNDAVVKICMDCETIRPKERDHLFGGSGNGVGQHGVGEGNRHAGRAGR